MAKLLNQYNTDIETGDIIQSSHITQFADALTGKEEYNISIFGSLKLTGSFDVKRSISIYPIDIFDDNADASSLPLGKVYMASGDGANPKGTLMIKY